jgi:hypothetical protein
MTNLILFPPVQQLPRASEIAYLVGISSLATSFAKV